MDVRFQLEFFFCDRVDISSRRENYIYAPRDIFVGILNISFLIDQSISFFFSFLLSEMRETTRWSAIIGIPQVAFPGDRRPRGINTWRTAYIPSNIRRHGIASEATVTDDKRLTKVSITRMRAASQTRVPRDALYLLARAPASAGIVQRCTPDTCCLGRALGKTRCLLGEREREGRNDAYKLRSPVRPVCSPLLRARCSRLLNVPLDWFTAAVPANYLSLLSLFLRYRHS